VEADEAYLEYVTARVPALRRLAYSLCGDDHQADDLVQETLTKLYLRWGRARAADNMHAYVHTMLVRAFLDEKRRGWWKVLLPGAVPERPAAEPAGSPEDRAVLRAALSKVPRRQQAVLVLRFLHDLPVDEVAQILDCSAGTVKSQSSRGLAALRRHLGEQTGFAGLAQAGGAS
jgi:RNA polymerase sigma-70 factor (sigma-E family)